MKRTLSLILILCTMLPTSFVDSYAYNESHTFQTQLEDARAKTVQISVWNIQNYPWATYNTFITSGTGALIGDGLILTNAHVIHKDQNEITVKTYTGEVYVAEVVKMYAEKDLALLKIDDEREGFIMNVAELHKGKPIMTVGNPLGLPQWSFSEGTVQIVSYDYRDAEGGEYSGIVTDAQVKGGNSGGPLINDQGELIGIVRAAEPYYSYVIPMSDITAFLKEEVK